MSFFTLQIQWTTDCTRALIQCKQLETRKPLKELRKKQVNTVTFKYNYYKKLYKIEKSLHYNDFFVTAKYTNLMCVVIVVIIVVVVVIVVVVIVIIVFVVVDDNNDNDNDGDARDKICFIQ